MKSVWAVCSFFFVIGCSSESEPTPIPKPIVVSTIPTPKPMPIYVRECIVTKTTVIKDCTLYDLLCDDGDTDMVFLCPITYWDKSLYIPLPP